MRSNLRRPRPKPMFLRKSTGDTSGSCTVGTSSMTSCSTQSPNRTERREPTERRRKSHADVPSDTDEDSLQDILDTMIAESSAKWKSNMQTMQTSTMLQSSWNSLTSMETTTPPAPVARVASVEDLVRKQQEEIQLLRDALATTAPISHVSIPASSAMEHDELTVDL